MTEETKYKALSLPPAFRGVIAGEGYDALTAARAMAADGADPATFVWARRDDVADGAIVLAPEESLARSLPAAYVTMVALGDALGVLIPPFVPVAFGWPDRVLVNGASVGGVRLAAPDDVGPRAVPAWMVAGFTVALRHAPEGGEPGRRPDRTTLETEGCSGLAAHEMLECFARHFLSWMNRWQDDGFAPVRTAWLARAAGYGRRNEGLEVGGPWANRKLVRMEANGSVLLSEDGKKTRHPLADILAGPTWTI